MSQPERLSVAALHAVHPAATKAARTSRSAGGMTLDELLELGRTTVTVDLPTAGRPYNLSRNQAYALAAAGQFPVPVLRVGQRLRVSTAVLLKALGVESDPAGGGRTG